MYYAEHYHLDAMSPIPWLERNNHMPEVSRLSQTKNYTQTAISCYKQTMANS